MTTNPVPNPVQFRADTERAIANVRTLQRLRRAVEAVGPYDPDLPTIRHDSDFPNQIECPFCEVDYGADNVTDLLALIESHIADVHEEV
jgi:hypothetical protein